MAPIRARKASLLPGSCVVSDVHKRKVSDAQRRTFARLVESIHTAEGLERLIGKVRRSDTNRACPAPPLPSIDVAQGACTDDRNLDCRVGGRSSHSDARSTDPEPSTINVFSSIDRLDSAQQQVVREVRAVAGEVTVAARANRRAEDRELQAHDWYPTDEELLRSARHTDKIGLLAYDDNVQRVPRIVNTVSLATVSCVAGRNAKLPLNLRHIAEKCNGAYFAPNRFAAVQLAYHNPRCRVLVFHTGKLVGTGTNGSAAARVAIMMAVRQLALEAGVFLYVDEFKVINSVGTCSLGVNVNCEAFANANSGEVHYDRSSFVGMAWRPPNEPICVECYGTGRLNIPGARRRRDLIDAFGRLLPRLLTYSTVALDAGGVPCVSTAVEDDGDIGWCARGKRMAPDLEEMEDPLLGDVVDDADEGSDADADADNDVGEDADDGVTSERYCALSQ